MKRKSEHRKPAPAPKKKTAHVLEEKNWFLLALDSARRGKIFGFYSTQFTESIRNPASAVKNLSN